MPSRQRADVASLRSLTFVCALAAALGGAGPGWAQTSDDQAYDCVVKPSLIVRLGTPVSGLLEEVLVDRGLIVKSGQVVARMRDSLERVTVSFNETRATSTADLDANRARLALAEKSLERAEQLYKKKIVSTGRIEELSAEVEVGEQNVRRSEVEQRLAQLELERSLVQLAARVIRSPIDGVVTGRLLSGGEYAQQEAYIIEVAQLDPLHVDVFLPVELYGQIRVGMIAKITFQEPIGGTFRASVDVVDLVLDAASGTFGVRLALPNPDLVSPAGIRCKARFPFTNPAASN